MVLERCQTDNHHKNRNLSVTGRLGTAYIAESPQHSESDALFVGFVLFGAIALMIGGDTDGFIKIVGHKTK